MIRTRQQGAGRRNGQFTPRVCGGCGALVRDAHRTAKQEVECRASAVGITISRETAKNEDDPIGNLDAPEGCCFEPGTHALTFMDWQDALERLTSTSLVKCTEDCDCRADIPREATR